MYISYAYGVQSRELAEAVWRNQEFDPLDRFSANAAGRQSREAYMSSLLRWGFTRSSGKAKPVVWAPEAEHRSSPLSEAAVARLYHRD